MNHTLDFISKNTGKLVATGYIRVVIGGQGPYIEFDLENLVDTIECEPGQEYRYSERYKNCKYYWLRPKNDSSVKIYHQKGLVNYADYKIDKYYISPDQLDWDDSELYAEENKKQGKGVITTYKKTV